MKRAGLCFNNCVPHLAAILVDPFVLDIFPVTVTQASVISQRCNPSPLKTVSQIVAVITRQTIHDPRVTYTQGQLDSQGFHAGVKNDELKTGQHSRG